MTLEEREQEHMIEKGFYSFGLLMGLLNKNTESFSVEQANIIQQRINHVYTLISQGADAIRNLREYEE